MHKRNISKLSLGRIGKINLVGITSMLVLVIVGLMLVTPTTNTEASAESFSTGVNTNVAALVRSSIAVSVSSTVDLDLTPSSRGSFSTGEAKLEVSTNNTTGYSVYMKTQDDTSKLLPVQTGVTASIGEINGTMNATNFQNNLNSWGYAVTSSTNANSSYTTAVEGATDTLTTEITYQSIPRSSDAAIITTNTTDQEDSYTLSFSVAVGPTLPSGIYTNELVVSVVANPIEVRSLTDITLMQEMTPEICKISYENETKQLVDSRDGKSYWVAKLKDGNCWMTQNLALDLSTEKTLMPSDTDITEPWTPNSSTNDLKFDGNTVDTQVDQDLSWNLGEIVMATPTTYNPCRNYTSDDGSTHYSAKFSDDLAEVCKNSGLVNVADDDWQPTFEASAGNFGGEAHDVVAVDEATKTYDAHYLLGNYYFYSAATADSTNDMSVWNSKTTEDICPRGWSLPATSKDGETNLPRLTDRSLYNLLLAYGYPVATTESYIVNEWGNARTEILKGDDQDIHINPMYYIVAGQIEPRSGYFTGINQTGTYWTNTIASASMAYSNYVAVTAVYPVFPGHRVTGYPIRCMAK